MSIYTRNLNEITERLPGVVDLARTFPADSFVLDGEALVVDPATGRPVAFQDSASEIRSEDDGRTPTGAVLQPFFFDLVHLDGRDLMDEPLAERRLLLAEVAGEHHVPGSMTDDAETGEAVLASALAAGHEGVVVKGRRRRTRRAAGARPGAR